MVYLDNNLKPKALTQGSDISKAAVSLEHIGPALFLQLQLVKLHTHQGSDSRTLDSSASPEMVKGYRPLEREEHGVATWTGGAAASGSIALTFGTAFKEAPSVIVSVSGVANANKQTTTGASATTGVTIYWKDDTGATATSVPITWIAKGR